MGEFSVTSTNIFIHEEYPGDNGIANDICLIRTPNLSNRKPASCDGCYASACLPAADFRPGEACHVSGWGTTTLGGGGSVSNKLREVDEDLVDGDIVSLANADLLDGRILFAAQNVLHLHRFHDDELLTDNYSVAGGNGYRLDLPRQAPSLVARDLKGPMVGTEDSAIVGRGLSGQQR